MAREGKKVLDLLINRTLIEQALRGKKLEVTAAEIDQEIETVAQRFGITREGWLRTLDKDAQISPIQYARDIIYPALALRKLCSGRVQVTPEDLKDAFEPQYGEKLRCRMILVDKQNTAMEIWEELRQNPGGFEKIAKEQSMDPAAARWAACWPSRSPGTPIPRPSPTPRSTSSSMATRVDHDPSHKPKDGDFTGPIQVGEAVWVILRRESVIPAAKGVNLKDEQVRKQTYDMIYEVKLKEAMAKSSGS